MAPMAHGLTWQIRFMARRPTFTAFFARATETVDNARTVISPNHELKGNIMALTLKAPPAEGSGIIREALGELAGGPPTAFKALAESADASSNFSIAAPHP